MNWVRIWTIIDKEWAEVFKNRVVVLTVVLLPLIFTALPIVLLYSTRSAAVSSGDSADLPAAFLATCGGLTAGECLQVYLVNQFLLLYMIMPLAIPIAIAAYSVVGEKTTRSLEPLLATPITTEELLIAKALAAAVPAVAATWIGFAVFTLAAPLAGATPAVAAGIFSATWLVAIGLVGPLVSIAAVNFALMVSSRVSDPRVAEQVSMVLIVPFMMVFLAQIAGFLVVNLTTVLITAAVLALADLGLIYLGARLFQREAILTQWK